jgi:hypothetical protein
MTEFQKPRGSALLLTLALAAGGACDKGGAQAQEAAPKEQISAVKVSLPPKPNFQEGKAPEKWEDGSYSIYGLRSKMEERLEEGERDTEIILKGYVQEIYQKPECTGDLCPPGKQPHFWMTDSADDQGKKRAILVANYAYPIADWEMKTWKGVPSVVIEKGKRYTIKGHFKRFSSSGFAQDNGLFEFVAYHPVDENGVESPEWIVPPKAPWHPILVAMEQEGAQQVAQQTKKALDRKKK